MPGARAPEQMAEGEAGIGWPVAIQDAMGWLDSHSHDFKIRPLRRACLDIRVESPFALDDLEEAAPVLTTEVAVADFIQEPGDRAQ